MAFCFSIYFSVEVRAFYGYLNFLSPFLGVGVSQPPSTGIFCSLSNRPVWLFWLADSNSILTTSSKYSFYSRDLSQSSEDELTYPPRSSTSSAFEAPFPLQPLESPGVISQPPLSSSFKFNFSFLNFYSIM